MGSLEPSSLRWTPAVPSNRAGSLIDEVRLNVSQEKCLMLLGNLTGHGRFFAENRELRSLLYNLNNLKEMQVLAGARSSSPA